MRAVIQRVERAQVTVDGTVVGRIGQGLAVLLGGGGAKTPVTMSSISRGSCFSFESSLIEKGR